MLPLQRLAQAGATQRLGIQALGGQEQQGEVGRVRRAQVLLADGLGFQPQPRLDRPAGQFRRRRVGALLRLQQALVVLARELGVDRQPDRLAVVALPGELQREFDAPAAARHRLDVGRVLLRREHLFQQRRQLHLAEDPARLDVGQHPVQRTHIARQRLHLAQAPVDLLQPLGDLLEALAQPLLQRRVQLLVHGRPHLLELLLVVLLDRLQPGLHRATGFRQARLVALGQRLQLLRQHRGRARGGGVLRLARGRGLLRQRLLQLRQLHAEGVDLLVLRARRIAALRQQRLLELGERCQRLLAQAGVPAADFLAQAGVHATQLIAQRPLQALQPFPGLLHQRAHGRRRIRAGLSSQREPDGDEKDHDHPGEGEMQQVNESHRAILSAPAAPPASHTRI